MKHLTNFPIKILTTPNSQKKLKHVQKTLLSNQIYHFNIKLVEINFFFQHMLVVFYIY